MIKITLYLLWFIALLIICSRYCCMRMLQLTYYEGWWGPLLILKFFTQLILVLFLWATCKRSNSPTCTLASSTILYVLFDLLFICVCSLCLNKWWIDGIKQPWLIGLAVDLVSFLLRLIQAFGGIRKCTQPELFQYLRTRNWRHRRWYLTTRNRIAQYLTEWPWTLGTMTLTLSCDLDVNSSKSFLPST